MVFWDGFFKALKGYQKSRNASKVQKKRVTSFKDNLEHEFLYGMILEVERGFNQHFDTKHPRPSDKIEEIAETIVKDVSEGKLVDLSYDELLRRID